MPRLYPINYNSAPDLTAASTSSKAAGFRRGAAANSEDYIRDGNNRIMGCGGVASWLKWCWNCLNHQRFSSPYFSRSFGVELQGLPQLNREEAESLIRREITAALLADPYGRTKGVQILEIVWEGDQAAVTLELLGANLETADLTVRW